MIDTKVRSHPSSVRCSFCHGDLVGDAAECRRCHTVLHAECARLASRCPTLGCEGRLAVHRASPARRTRWSAGIVLAALAALAYLALLLGVGIHVARLRAANLAALGARGVLVRGVVTEIDDSMLVEYRLGGRVYHARRSARDRHVGQVLPVRALPDHPEVCAFGDDSGDEGPVADGNLLVALLAIPPYLVAGIVFAIAARRRAR